MNANAPMLISHTIRLPRSLRSACAVGEESRRRFGSAVSRVGTTPVPTSRPAAIRAAAASSSTLAATGSTRTSGWAPLNGRSSSAHPSGVAQRNQPAPLDVSAITRSRNNSPTTAPPSSSAIRRVGASWLATAPMPTNTGTTDAVARARYADPPTGRPACDEAGELREPQDQDAGRDRGHRREIRRAPPEHPSQHELHPARVLLGPERSHGGQQSEDRGDDRQRTADAPGGVAARPSAGRVARRRTGGSPCCRRSCGRTPRRSEIVG